MPNDFRAHYRRWRAGGVKLKALAQKLRLPYHDLQRLFYGYWDEDEACVGWTEKHFTLEQAEARSAARPMADVEGTYRLVRAVFRRARYDALHSTTVDGTYARAWWEGTNPGLAEWCEILGEDMAEVQAAFAQERDALQRKGERDASGDPVWP